MMKNRSIRFKMTLWYSLVLIALVVLTFLIVYMAGRMVLRTTNRDYLIGAVEENVDKIRFTEEKHNDPGRIYIPYKEGYLEVDEAFLDVINDVHAGLYAADGSMLYGENPLARDMETASFTDTCIYYCKVGGVSYGFYDRRLNLELPDGEALWLRGAVSEAKGTEELQKVSRIFLILFPVLIAVSVVFGYLLTGRMLRPIRQIERTAERISQGADLKQRLDAGKNQDEIGRLAAVFNRMLERLERSFEAEQQFTSDASHELRTPTSVILAECEYMLEKQRGAEEYGEALQVIKRQAERMTELIRDMLDFARIDQNSGQYAMEPLELSLLTEEMAEQLSGAGERGITLQYDIAPGIEVKGNRLLLSRLLQNLIGNAYRYGKENGHILVRLYKKGDRAVLSVTDDGIGIAPEEQKKIFDRFYRSDASRSVYGTGLGLSMVKRIAELHDAELCLESEPGKGSCFQVSIKIFCNSNVSLILAE